MLSLPITQDKTKTYYPLLVIDLGFQMNYVTPKKIRFFEENAEDLTDINLCVRLIKH